MPYGQLRSRLVDGVDCPPVVTLPDGSIDRYWSVHRSSGERIESKSAFGELVASQGVRSLQLEAIDVRPGGQAVNAARQSHALGAPVELYGHLDAPELDGLPFETVSMGEPATVNVLSFDETVLMLSVESGAIEDWTIEDLFDAVTPAPDDWVSDGVVLVQNWAGFSGMTDALAALADVDLGDATVVFDAGDVSSASTESLESLCAVLAEVSDSVDLVVTANDRELDRLAEVVGVDDDESREAKLREALDVHAVVLHYETHAVAATPRGVDRVENFSARRIARRTGAGDRFNGALATGLAAGYPWEECLALGNACATHFIENGTTASRADLLGLLADRSVD